MNICLLGATGSVGSNVLKVLKDHAAYQVTSLLAHSSVTKLWQQQRATGAKLLVLKDPAAYEQLQHLAAGTKTAKPKLLLGGRGMAEVIEHPKTDCVINALSGTAGLEASLIALSAGKKLFLANKESLVAGGKLLLDLAARNKTQILPIDSEHNAILRCLPRSYRLGDNPSAHGVRRLWLTASGGPFLKQELPALHAATTALASQHPTWSMGYKISIDSATMMNKGFEIIEACHLFALPQEQIEVVIQPQSIVHCMVEYTDGSFICQFSKPDMCITIHQALSYPSYTPLKQEALNPLQLGKIEFCAPDEQKFPALRLARTANKLGGIAPLALSISDDHAVAAFRAGKISFAEISQVIAKTLENYGATKRELPTDFNQIQQLSEEISLTCEEIIAT